MKTDNAFGSYLFKGILGAFSMIKRQPTVRMLHDAMNNYVNELNMRYAGWQNSEISEHSLV